MATDVLSIAAVDLALKEDDGARSRNGLSTAAVILSMATDVLAPGSFVVPTSTVVLLPSSVVGSGNQNGLHTTTVAPSPAIVVLLPSSAVGSGNQNALSPATFVLSPATVVLSPAGAVPVGQPGAFFGFFDPRAHTTPPGEHGQGEASEDGHG